MRLEEVFKDPLKLEAICLWDESRRATDISPESLKTLYQQETCEVFKDAVRELSSLDWLESPDLADIGQEQLAGIQQTTFPIQQGLSPIAGYTLLSRIGKGSFGEVWKAVGPGDYELAIKIIPMQDGLDLVEIRALELFKVIRHPHLISIYGFWLIKGYLWIAMELAECNLLEYLKIHNDDKVINEVFADAAEAIDYLNLGIQADSLAQKVPILHRDIKPQNMLIVGGKLKLGDFGLARTLDLHKNEHSGCLTATYSPPEFFKGRMAMTSDQYSLAISYCKIKGGRVPFTGSSAEVMAGHCNIAPDLSMLPENKQTAVRKALSKNPEDRWNTCTEFIQHLFNPLKSNSVKAGFVSKSKLALSLSVGFAIIVFALFWSFHFYKAKKKQPENAQFPESVMKVHQTGEVICLAVSDDENTALTGGEDKQVVLWDLKNKKPLHYLKGHDQKVLSVSISADGSKGLSGGAYLDNRVILWDLKKGIKINEFLGHQHGIRSVKFLPNGNQAVSAGLDCTARLWDLNEGKQIRFFENLDTLDPKNIPNGSPKQVWAMDITKNGKKMISCLRNGKINVHDLETGSLLRAFGGPEQYFRGFSMSNDGSQAYTSFGGSSQTLRNPDLSILKWDLEKGTYKELFKADTVVECLYLSRNNNNLFGIQRTHKGFVWDDKSRSLNNCFEQLDSAVNAVIEGFSMDKLYLACKDGTLQVFDLNQLSSQDKSK